MCIADSIIPRTRLRHAGKKKHACVCGCVKIIACLRDNGNRLIKAEITRETMLRNIVSRVFSARFSAPRTTVHIPCSAPVELFIAHVTPYTASALGTARRWNRDNGHLPLQPLLGELIHTKISCTAWPTATNRVQLVYAAHCHAASGPASCYSGCIPYSRYGIWYTIVQWGTAELCLWLG